MRPALTQSPIARAIPSSITEGRSGARLGGLLRLLFGTAESIDVEPVRVLRVAALDHVEELLLEKLGDGSAPALADLAAVHLADRRHLGGRAGEERLVGDVELVAAEALLLDGDVVLARQRHDRVARDAGQHAGERRRLDLPVADDEEVLPRALGAVALGVEHDRLVEAERLRLAFGEDAGHVVAGQLAARHDRVGLPAGVGGDLGADALLESVLAEILAPL